MESENFSTFLKSEKYINHFQPLSTIFSHYQPFSAIINHFQPLSIIISHYQSLSAIISQYQSLSTIINHFQPLSAIFSQYQSLSTFMNHFKPFSFRLAILIFIEPCEQVNNSNPDIMVNHIEMHVKLAKSKTLKTHKN